MFSAKTKSRFAGLVLASAVLAAPVAAAAGVVVKSTGPSASKYPVGSKIDDSATITLKAGDSVTVLTKRGTKVMKGAGTFKVGEKPKVTRARFAALTRKSSANRVRVGSVRAAVSGDTKPTNPNIWYLDITQSGPMCLYSADDVRMWRPSAEVIETYKVAGAGSSVDVTFDASDAVAPLDPSLLTVAPGESYTITSPDGATSTSVTFTVLEGDFSQADALAEALAEAGCMNQLGQMADRLGG